MQYLFLILSVALFSYSHEQPHCAIGGVIFAVIGVLMISEASMQKLRPKEKSGLKRKNRF